MKHFLSLVIALLVSSSAWAATFINTVGMDKTVAIAGYDTVAFFVSNKAVVGRPEFEHEYLEATWRFSSQTNLDEFKKNPERYMPAWGGQCAWCVSENCVSEKKLSGDFEIMDGKLYLFGPGTNTKSGAKDSFLYGRISRAMRVREGDKHWPELKRRLEAGELQQPDASSFKKTRFD